MITLDHRITAGQRPTHLLQLWHAPAAGIGHDGGCSQHACMWISKWMNDMCLGEAWGSCGVSKADSTCPLAQHCAEAAAMRLLRSAPGLRYDYPQGGSCSSARWWPLLRSRRWAAEPEAGATAGPASADVAAADAAASSSSSLAPTGAALPCAICAQLGLWSNKQVYAVPIHSLLLML